MESDGGCPVAYKELSIIIIYLHISKHYHAMHSRNHEKL